MTKNVSDKEKIIRVAIATVVTLGYYYNKFPEWLAYVLMVIAIYLLVTALIGKDPIKSKLMKSK